MNRGSRTPVSNLLSALGQIKETNISAVLGYLFYLNPPLSEKIFKIKEPIEKVYVESQSEGKENRYDIVLESFKRQYFIEIKIDEHSAEQLHRYLWSSKHLFIIGQKLGTHKVQRKLRDRFIDWSALAGLLLMSKSTGRKANHFYNGLVDEFILHLKENNMVKGSLKDVYLRDLSGDSVEWYFNRCVFFTQAKFYDGSKNARYFAPYLTASNKKGDRSSVFRSLGVGISFVSKIEDRYLGTPKELRTMMLAKKWSKKEIDEVFAIQKWKDNTRTKFAVFFLDNPMRLFQRPVTKVDLWGVVTGAMPSLSVDFGDLVAAANGLQPFKRKAKKISRQKNEK